MNGANGANEGINEPEKINIPENEPLNATKDGSTTQKNPAHFQVDNATKLNYIYLLLTNYGSQG
jgi:hypothetical protein